MHGRHTLAALIVFLCLAPYLSIRAYCQQEDQQAGQPVPQIDEVSQYQPTSPKATADRQTYILEISGQNLPATTPQIIVFPAAASSPRVLSQSSTKVIGSVDATTGYSVQQLVLSYTGRSPVFSPPLTPSTCKVGRDIDATFQLIDSSHAAKTFGVGVAKNFLVVQLSMLNHCALPITVPLPSITIETTKNQDSVCGKQTFNTAGQNASRANVSTVDAESRGQSYDSIHVQVHPGGTANPRPLVLSLKRNNPAITPSTLGFVASFFTSDKQVLGRRALFFNSIAAAAALGSAIQPYAGHGFAEGIAILGGGFTSAAQMIYKDESAQQLQALTSYSFGDSEQLASRTGSLQKYLFVPTDPHLECALEHDLVTIHYVAIPVISSGTGIATPSR